jgi:hypothetical protein
LKPPDDEVGGVLASGSPGLLSVGSVDFSIPWEQQESRCAHREVEAVVQAYKVRAYRQLSLRWRSRKVTARGCGGGDGGDGLGSEDSVGLGLGAGDQRDRAQLE